MRYGQVLAVGKGGHPSQKEFLAAPAVVQDLVEFKNRLLNPGGVGHALQRGFKRVQCRSPSLKTAEQLRQIQCGGLVMWHR